MIELEGIQGPREPLSEELPAMELYEGLLRYRGRTVRVQYSWVDRLEKSTGKRSEQVQVNYEYRSLRDQVGVLTGLYLRHSEFFYPNEEESSSPDTFLNILVDGEKLKDLKLERTRIQVFQEDTGNWEALFQGSTWTDFDKDYLRTYR